MLEFATVEELEARLVEAGASPRQAGTVEMIVCRPGVGERTVVERAELDPADGLQGDGWKVRAARRAGDGALNPATQITLMNSRVIQAIAGDRSQWPPAGDQLFVDLDLSAENLPPGQEIAVGTAVLQISEVPHTGCAKFTERYGHGAVRFVNSEEGRMARRRGVNARVVSAGTVCTGDTVSKI